MPRPPRARPRGSCSGGSSICMPRASRARPRGSCSGGSSISMPRASRGSCSGWSCAKALVSFCIWFSTCACAFLRTKQSVVGCIRLAQSSKLAYINTTGGPDDFLRVVLKSPARPRCELVRSLLTSSKLSRKCVLGSTIKANLLLKTLQPKQSSRGPFPQSCMRRSVSFFCWALLPILSLHSRICGGVIFREATAHTQLPF